MKDEKRNSNRKDKQNKTKHTIHQRNSRYDITRNISAIKRGCRMMLQKCPYCGELIFFREKGHGKGVCDKKVAE